MRTHSHLHTHHTHTHTYAFKHAHTHTHTHTHIHTHTHTHTHTYTHTHTPNTQVEPKMYGPNLKETIKEKLVEVVENTCSERYGFILKVFNVDTERLEGRIESTGMQSGRGGTATFTGSRAWACARALSISGCLSTLFLSPCFCPCPSPSFPLWLALCLSPSLAFSLQPSQGEMIILPAWHKELRIILEGIELHKMTVRSITHCSACCPLPPPL